MRIQEVMLTDFKPMRQHTSSHVLGLQMPLLLQRVTYRSQADEDRSSQSDIRQVLPFVCSVPSISLALISFASVRGLCSLHFLAVSLRIIVAIACVMGNRHLQCTHSRASREVWGSQLDTRHLKSRAEPYPKLPHPAHSLKKNKPRNRN
ncbi:hypothetical protein J3F83DRAFT_32844 [Trichoderma novae-zelandiae]